MDTDTYAKEDIDLTIDAVIGDDRSFVAYRLSASYLPEDESVIGEAWQDDLGNLYGTGVCEMMLFEPLFTMMYLSSSIGLDKSPLAMLASRLAASPFIRIEWK